MPSLLDNLVFETKKTAHEVTTTAKLNWGDTTYGPMMKGMGHEYVVAELLARNSKNDITWLGKAGDIHIGIDMKAETIDGLGNFIDIQVKYQKETYRIKKGELIDVISTWKASLDNLMASGKFSKSDIAKRKLMVLTNTTFAPEALRGLAAFRKTNPSLGRRIILCDRSWLDQQAKGIQYDNFSQFEKEVGEARQEAILNILAYSDQADDRKGFKDNLITKKPKAKTQKEYRRETLMAFNGSIELPEANLTKAGNKESGLAAGFCSWLEAVEFVLYKNDFRPMQTAEIALHIKALGLRSSHTKKPFGNGLYQAGVNTGVLFNKKGDEPSFSLMWSVKGQKGRHKVGLLTVKEEMREYVSKKYADIPNTLSGQQLREIVASPVSLD